MTIRGTNGYFGRAKFRAHLRDLSPDTIVGQAGFAHMCPIAAEVKRCVPAAEYVSVKISAIKYNVNAITHIHDTPQWARRFIEAIDDYHHLHAPITAAEALLTLSAIP